jgi:hypothetical protein
MIIEFLEWLQSTPWSVRLIESLYMWPLLEATHVVTLALFAGTTIMMDLRLAGVTFRGVPVSEFTGKMLPWTRGAFGVMIVTGMLLFYSSPVGYYHNFFFRIKFIFMLLAGLNVWLFHSRIHRRIREWDRDPVPPRAARIAAAVSLVAWALVIVAGRLTAYNWFDCGIQPQPDFVNWMANCPLLTGTATLP